MKKIVEFAPAKLNLFLDVTGRRENGYHEIDSIMQTVSLCDEIRMEIDGGCGIDVICESPFAPDGKDNIMWRAADKYLSENKINTSLKIELVKKIPSPAGMGGGSADAAAVLRGLNAHFCAMRYDDLVELALKVGSDVPFCLNGGTQRVRGLGEKLEPINGPTDETVFLIAVSGEDVPTPEAYKSLDVKYSDFEDYRSSRVPNDLIAAINNHNRWADRNVMFNIFEDVVLPQCPKAANAKKIMYDSGALGAMMSGSGASVFGVFKSGDEEKLMISKKKLEESGVMVYTAKPFK